MALQPTKVTRGMYGVTLNLVFELMHQQGLMLDFSGKIILGGGHIMALSHGCDSECQSCAPLITVMNLTNTLEIGYWQIRMLKASQLSMKTHHGIARNENP
ncbi:protein of unknown function [Cyanobium sp. NIES-981]|nr:protein of unknown function [Cyanobium sp. NIES-981]